MQKTYSRIIHKSRAYMTRRAPGTNIIRYKCPEWCNGRCIRYGINQTHWLYRSALQSHLDSSMLMLKLSMSDLDGFRLEDARSWRRPGGVSRRPRKFPMLTQAAAIWQFPRSSRLEGAVVSRRIACRSPGFAWFCPIAGVEPSTFW